MISLVQHGPNSSTIHVGTTSFLFSYEMCVAFCVAGDQWVVSENVWSPTTGKHIGAHFRPTYPRTKYVEFVALLRALDVTVREEQDA